MKDFNGKEFTFQVIAKGSYIDPSSGDGKAWIVEATTLRLNPVALNEYITAYAYNSPDCYNSEAEWRAYEEEIKERVRDFATKVADGLGVDTAAGRLAICQVQSEVFATVYVYEEGASKK